MPTFTSGPKEGTIQTDGLKKALKWIILAVVLMVTLMVFSITARFNKPPKITSNACSEKSKELSETVSCFTPTVRLKTNMVEVLITTTNWHDFNVAGKEFEVRIVRIGQTEIRFRKNQNDDWIVQTPDNVSGKMIDFGPNVSEIGYRIKPGHTGTCRVFLMTREIL